MRTKSLQKCEKKDNTKNDYNVSYSVSVNQSNLVFVKRCLNKVLRGASYE